MLEEIVSVLFSILGNQFHAAAPLANLVFIGSIGRLQSLLRRGKLNPAGRAEIYARMGIEICLITMAVAHQQADAIVRARQNERRLSRAQSFASSAAERVSQ